jgi:hypothetical protein
MLKNSTNAYLSQLSISAWNIHGLGDKIEDHIFREKLNSDINILLETWTGENKKYILPEFNTISKCRKKKINLGAIAVVLLFIIKRQYLGELLM